MKAALYSRVSTIEQATEGYSIGVQNEKLTFYAKAQNYEIGEVYCDDGYSGKDLVRPAMKRLLNDVKNDKINIVLIYKLDRLSRRVKDVLELVEMFDEHNVTLYSLSENFDLSSPFGRAALKMMATFSELERETIVERMQMGKFARKKSGKYTCPGKNCPFGYRHDKTNDRLVINEPEAEAIRKIFDLYINEGYTFRKLYDYCKTAYGDMHYFNNQMCCKPIIQRLLYAGYLETSGGLVKGINFEPIITYETFLQAQSHVEKNKTKRSGDCSPYLLTGLVYCGKCGNRYVGKLYERYSLKGDEKLHTKHYRYRDYGCAARVKRDKKYHPANCKNDIYRAEELEDYVENFVRNIDFSELKNGTYTAGTIDNLILELDELKATEERLLDLYISGTIDKDTFFLKKLPIDSKQNQIRTLMDEAKNVVQTSSPDTVVKIKENIQKYDTLSKSHKKSLLESLIDKIVIDGDNICIKLRLK